MSENKEIKVGDLVWSSFFNDYIEVVEIVSDTKWFFRFKGKLYPAKTKLSWFLEHDSKVFRRI